MFKVANKGTRTTSSEMSQVSLLEDFNVDFDHAFVCWALFLLVITRVYRNYTNLVRTRILTNSSLNF